MKGLRLSPSPRGLEQILDFRSRVFIQIHGCVGERAENGRWTFRRNWLNECAPHNGGLPLPWNGDNKFGHTEQRGNRERNCAVGNILRRAEPAHNNLLLTTQCIKMHKLEIEGI